MFLLCVHPMLCSLVSLPYPAVVAQVQRLPPYFPHLLFSIMVKNHPHHLQSNLELGCSAPYHSHPLGFALISTQAQYFVQQQRRPHCHLVILVLPLQLLLLSSSTQESSAKMSGYDAGSDFNSGLISSLLYSSFSHLYGTLFILRNLRPCWAFSLHVSAI